MRPRGRPGPLRDRRWFLAANVFLTASVIYGCEQNSPRQAANQDTDALDEAPVWEAAPRLPRAVANNAVVGTDLADESHVYSFLGIDETRRWDGVVSWAFRWTVGSQEWEELPPVPGPGRLAATAEAVGGRVYVFGGYTVAADGSEASVPNVDVFDPATDQWAAGTPIPVPVDDAISGVWQDSLIVLVSGWHDTDNVAEVQVYDPGADSWTQATPIPGPPVFGHAGGIVTGHVVYLGGANTGGTTPRYRIERSAWAGSITPGQLASELIIEWRSLNAHPGPPRYRAASGTVGPWMVFAGGTDNPYNYDGMGYDGIRSEALAHVFAFHEPSGRWVEGPPLPEPRMDHRALAVAGGVLALVGGMDENGDVTPTVFLADEGALIEALMRDAR